MASTITAAGPSPARTRRIATFSTYAEAERAVDTLADRRFPVEHVAVVGRGLKMVEHVTGRRGLGGAALNGLATGALVGAFAGWFFSLFGWADPLVATLSLILYGLVLGAFVGAALAATGHLTMRGRRDFASVPGMQADAFDLLVDEEYAADAEHVLKAGRRAS